MTSKSNETQCFTSINACSCRSIRKWDTFIFMISIIVCRVTLWRPWGWSNYEIKVVSNGFIWNICILPLLGQNKRFVSCYPKDCIILQLTKKKNIGIFTIFSFAWNVYNEVHVHLSDIRALTITFCCKNANQQIYYKKSKKADLPTHYFFSA